MTHTNIQQNLLKQLTLSSVKGNCHIATRAGYQQPNVTLYYIFELYESYGTFWYNKKLITWILSSVNGRVREQTDRDNYCIVTPEAPQYGKMWLIRKLEISKRGWRVLCQHTFEASTLTKTWLHKVTKDSKKGQKVSMHWYSSYTWVSECKVSHEKCFWQNVLWTNM